MRPLLTLPSCAALMTTTLAKHLVQCSSRDPFEGTNSHVHPATNYVHLNSITTTVLKAHTTLVHIVKYTRDVSCLSLPSPGSLIVILVLISGFLVLLLHTLVNYVCESPDSCLHSDFDCGLPLCSVYLHFVTLYLPA